MDIEDYARHRDELGPLRRASRASRFFELGPFCTVTFESYDSMWFQVSFLSLSLSLSLSLLYSVSAGHGEILPALALFSSS